MHFRANEALCFDDVLLVPGYSEILSRKDVNLSVKNILHKEMFDLPIFCAPMDTVVDSKSAREMSKYGVTPILHRYQTIENQTTEFISATDCLENETIIGAAIPATGDFLERAQSLHKEGCELFCVDVAHGEHISVKNALYELKKKFSDIKIMTGNITCRESYDALSSWGADFVRMSVGGGSVCSTRIVTGHGVPTLQAVLDCDERRKRRIYHGKFASYIVADGGIRNAGDIVKSFAAGADFVMLGSMLACHIESPGESIDGKKSYRGMASKDAQEDWRGFVSGVEGVSTWRPTKGHLKDTILNIRSGMQSGCSYSGAKNLEELYQNAIFTKVSPLAINESRPHGENLK
jgi:IMP dehydrogenase